MVDIVCVGDTAIDDYYRVSKLPGPDEKVLTNYTGRCLGGTADNTARGLHRLGADVLFLTRIGNDDHGKFIREQFKNIGLAARYLHSRQTPTAQILVAKDGEKAILLHGFDSLPDWEPGILRDFMKPVPARAVFSTLSLPVRDFLPDFQTDLIISLEPAIVEWDPGVFDWSARHAHTIILDRHTYHFIFHQEPSPENISHIFSSLPETLQQLIVTMGSHGCLGASRSPSEVCRVPSFNVQVVDTTGAGDLFNASFIYSFFVKNRTFKDSLRYANAIAAASCENPGTDLTATVLETGEKFFQEKA